MNRAPFADAFPLNHAAPRVARIARACDAAFTNFPHSCSPTGYLRVCIAYPGTAVAAGARGDARQAR